MKWAYYKWQQLKFYKDFDIVFGMRTKKKRHMAYLLRLQKVCQVCGTDKKLTIDHVTPLALKGSDALSNKQLLCESCNFKKGKLLYHVDPSKRLQMFMNRKLAPPLPLEMKVLVPSIWKLMKRRLK